MQTTELIQKPKRYKLVSDNKSLTVFISYIIRDAEEENFLLSLENIQYAIIDIPIKKLEQDVKEAWEHIIDYCKKEICFDKKHVSEEDVTPININTLTHPFG